MIAIAISGAPGAGKGTQSELIIKEYGFKYISTGEALRNEIDKDTQLGRQIKDTMQKGQFVSDEIVGKIIRKVVAEAKNNNCHGILFDGYPRTLNQAKTLDKLLCNENVTFKGMIALEVSQNVLIERILKRALISGRSDDNRESIENRLKEYKQKTTPIFNYYKDQNKYYEVNGIGEINDIYREVSKIIDSFKGVKK